MLVEDDAVLDRARQRVGRVISGKWTIDRLLGAGGMAVVYEATHRNRKRAALKMLHPELSADPDIRARFLREGYVANTVMHPGAVRVDDDDVTEDGSAYLVMELLEGETLDARATRKGGTLAVDEVLRIAFDVLGVLVAAHAAGVVHRDLKPENLFVRADGAIKVLDFGIARLRESSSVATATRSGSFMGTPAFMAPEQARGRWGDVDPRTDLWAVGAIAFTLLTGRLVHQAETVNEVMALACTQRAPALASVWPAAPLALAQVVDRALAYERADRFEDSASMQRAVREAYRAIVGREVDQAPALSVHEAPAAPGELSSVRVVGPKAAASATEVAVTRSAPRTDERRRPVALVVGIVAGVAVLGAGTALVLRSRAPRTVEATIQPLQTAAAPAVSEAVAAPSSSVAAPAVSDAPAAPSPAPPPSPAAVRPAAHRPAKAPPAAASPPPKPTGDPFSKRR